MSQFHIAVADTGLLYVMVRIFKTDRVCTWSPWEAP